jgi:hypothetical protein
MLYMIVEHFKNRDAVPIYRRFKEKGRLAPEGLRYVSSWVDSKMQICFQLMETHDRKLIDAWMLNWEDIVDFEVFQVMSSEEAAEKNAPALLIK